MFKGKVTIRQGNVTSDDRKDDGKEGAYFLFFRVRSSVILVRSIILYLSGKRQHSSAPWLE